MDKELRLIEKFINKTLNPEEEIEFKDLIKNDPNFAENLKRMQSLKSSINSEENEISTKRRKRQNTDEKILSLWDKPITWIAALVAILIIFGGYYLIQINSPSQLYSNYFQPYQEHLTVLGDNVESGDDHSRKLRDCMNLYNYKNYQEAYTCLSELNPKSIADQNEVKFFQSMSLINLGETQNSIKYLKQLVSQKKDNPYLDVATWYLALAHLEINQVEEAVSLFKSIAEKNDEVVYKRKEALNILEDIGVSD